MSKVEMAKMLIPACASGAVRLCRTPTIENSRVPTTLIHLHPLSDFTPSGTRDSRQTIESSFPILEIEKREEEIAHDGISFWLSKRHTDRVSGIRASFIGECILRTLGSIKTVTSRHTNTLCPSQKGSKDTQQNATGPKKDLSQKM